MMSRQIVNYVLGFMFNESKTEVLLIKKNRPIFLVNQLNGIGGKVEDFLVLANGRIVNTPEPPIEAMIREFQEETGVRYDDWEKACTIVDSSFGYRLYTFKAFSNEIYNAKTVTDEEVSIYEVNNLPSNLVESVRWIIPMLTENRIYNIEAALEW